MFSGAGRRRLDRVLALPSGDRLRLVWAVVALPLSAIGVRVFGLGRWMRLVERSAPAASVTRLPAEEKERVRETGRLVGIAARHAPYRGNCLSQSLTLWWLLLGQGIQSDLRIGVTSPPGRFEAHAWIEYDGAVINDRPDIGLLFRKFDRPINSSARFV